VPAFYIEQFGCRATQADGAAIERQLRDRGFSAAKEAAIADVVVINTCTVTAAADAQARDSIRKLHARNPAARIVVTGCYAQRAPEELAALPGVTFVVGNSHKPQIPHLIEGFSEQSDSPPVRRSSTETDFVPAAALGGVPFDSFGTPQNAGSRVAQILAGDISTETELLAAPVLGGEGQHTRPTLKIQDGCNLRCSYCVIPFVRGQSRSLPPGTVIKEIQRLSESGYREIVLSGINLGTYGRDLSPSVGFEGLLCGILERTGVERVRISSIEPQDVTRDLIELFATNPRIAQHFHMPLQSGSDRILAAMHRWYRTEHYARRVQLIQEHLPHAAIGADVITGFPGETEQDHAATMAFIEKLPFTYLHVFSYSRRPGTKAANLPSQLPGAIIKRRARELRALSERKSAVFRGRQLGRTLRVLTLHPGEHDTARTPALSSNYLRVHVPGTRGSNLWLDVSITEEDGKDLIGELGS
jgi:threonylcarbamoyladenosine tRNA methylthiotransferase MtaB